MIIIESIDCPNDDMTLSEVDTTEGGGEDRHN